jgi:hypothetical protein
VVDLPEVISIEEETEPRPRPHLSGRALGMIAAVLAVAAICIASVLILRGGDDAAESAAPASEQSRHLEVLSTRPLSTLAVERLLERRFLPVPDDDESDVTCSEREPRPAYSIRHCIVRYPGGTERQVVMLTDANGSEVLSER